MPLWPVRRPLHYQPSSLSPPLCYICTLLAISLSTADPSPAPVRSVGFYHNSPPPAAVYPPPQRHIPPRRLPVAAASLSPPPRLHLHCVSRNHSPCPCGSRRLPRSRHPLYPNAVRARLPRPRPFTPSGTPPGPTRDIRRHPPSTCVALLSIFARFMQIIVDRTPQKPI